MRTFGAIVAVLSLALSASAAAIYPRDGVNTNNIGGLAAVDTTADDILKHVELAHQEVHKPRQLGGLTSEVSKVVPRDETSYPSLVVGVTHEIVEIAAGLDVALEGTVKVQAVVDILAKIRVALDVCVEAVAKLDLKASTVLVLKGEVQVVAQIAALLSVLIHVVVKIVVAVLKVKVLADVSVVISVCTAICVDVAAIIKVGVALCPGVIAIIVRLCADIKVELVAAVYAHVFAAILACLHL